LLPLSGADKASAPPRAGDTRAVQKLQKCPQELGISWMLFDA
jgi:hypothetical protein